MTSPLVLNIETALSRVLHYNRQLMNGSEIAKKAVYGVELAASEFAIHISPNSQLGYAGGGTAGSGPSFGVGIDIAKKFATGTNLTFSPAVKKIGQHYHSDIRAIINQPLLRGFGREHQLANLRASKFAWRSAQRSFYILQIQIVNRTIQALYEVVKAEKALVLYQDSHQRIERFHRAAKIKEKIGLADGLDVYRAEIELHHAQDELTSAQERLQEVHDQLKDLLALPLDTLIQVDIPVVYRENNLSLEEALDLALKNRIEIEQAEDQLRENIRLSRLAKDNLYPELNLIINYANCGRDELFNRSCFRHRENTWALGFSTSSNFDPIHEQLLFEQSLLGVQSGQRAIEQIKASIVLDVKRSFRHIDRAWKKMHLQADQIQTAEGELRLSQLKFDRGMADNFNIIQAEKSLRSALLSYWNAVIDHIIGEFQFLAAMGLLTDKPCV